MRNNAINNDITNVFRAHRLDNVLNVTGNGVVWAAQWNAVDYNPLGAFSSATGQFTAPYDGYYLLCGNMQLSGIEAAHELYELTIVTTAGSFLASSINLLAFKKAATNRLVSPYAVQCKMLKTETAYLTVMVNGGLGSIDIQSGQGTNAFGGYLISHI